MLLRRSALAYLAMDGYEAAVGVTQPFGYLPFDILLNRIRCRFTADGTTTGPHGSASGSTPQPFQLWQNGAALGDPLLVGSHQSDLIEYDDPGVLLPGVTAGNIDTDGRIGMAGPLGLCTQVVWSFTANDPANIGKEIWGIGLHNFYDSTLIGLTDRGGLPWYFPLAYPLGDFWDADLSFFTPFELIDSPSRLAGEERGIAGIPLVRPGTFDDFFFISRDPSGTDGAYQIDFRVDGATAISIVTTAGATRIWRPTGPTSVHVDSMQRINGMLASGTGTLLNGGLLFTYRPDDDDSLVGLGAGESGGESIP
jgi:hypothetical protein